MNQALATRTSPSLAPGTLVLVPVGSLEQHGPHLPLDTDTVIAQAVTDEVAARLPGDVLVAPALSYGSSGEHQHFAGTSSIGSETLRLVIVELVRSMRTWAGRVLFINAHGGNLTALQGGVLQLLDEGHDVGWLACATEEVDAHAGFTETSLMLHLRPGSVRLDLAEAGNTAPIGDLLGALVSGGVIAVAPNGVLGDPAGADAGEGARLLEVMASDLVAAISRGSRDGRGRLR
ncbi:mycofactocin biosynthesis peptidyl-dipeptidase MftE [Nocardioides sp.]|uniref:mycofactocin biosynthesis peptidyl-dipeptidase MftE n=1 Tax=Nocardioides sp. TaxID=35761 RepID=UPI003D0C6B55